MPRPERIRSLAPWEICRIRASCPGYHHARFRGSFHVAALATEPGGDRARGLLVELALILSASDYATFVRMMREQNGQSGTSYAMLKTAHKRTRDDG